MGYNYWSRVVDEMISFENSREIGIRGVLGFAGIVDSDVVSAMCLVNSDISLE